jgi:protein O-GlcNAc transferase
MTIDQLLNLAEEHHQAGHLAEAKEIYRTVLAAQPNNIRAINNFGVALTAEGNWEQAIECFGCAVTAQPDSAEGHVNLGGALAAIGRRREAAAHFNRAVALQPNLYEAHYNLGVNLHELGELDQAIESLHHAIALGPNFANGWNNLANAYKATGQIEKAKEFYRRAFEVDPNFIGADSNRVYILIFDPQHTGQSFLRAQRDWQERHTKGLPTSFGPFTNDCSLGRRLKVGYVSPDFRMNCQSLFTEPLLLNHDHERFEIFCYSGVPQPDAVTERLKGYADIWRSTVAMSDTSLAETIGADAIDILVDLTMHMANGRPLVMARKPAPIQVAWLAYPGTTGLSAMDYRLTDSYLDPPNMHEDHYSEHTIRLPDTFWCYDPWGMEPDRSAAAGTGSAAGNFQWIYHVRMPQRFLQNQ